MNKKTQRQIMRGLAIALILLGLLTILPVGFPTVNLLVVAAILTGIFILLGW